VFTTSANPNRGGQRRVFSFTIMLVPTAKSKGEVDIEEKSRTGGVFDLL
jgi:hypothetical protein